MLRNLHHYSVEKLSSWRTDDWLLVPNNRWCYVFLLYFHISVSYQTCVFTASGVIVLSALYQALFPGLIRQYVTLVLSFIRHTVWCAVKWGHQYQFNYKYVIFKKNYEFVIMNTHTHTLQPVLQKCNSK